ncbi:MAG: ribonuclease III [Alphaproteobacteria bacterium]|nr:ribonuclease III [Alphaproteobacteria bacterium]
MTDDGLAALTATLGHRFADSGLLRAALDRNRSARGGAISQQERLEFLGDRVLGLIVADRLLAAFPDESEGALARRLAVLVSRDALAAAAREIGLGRFIAFGRGEAETGAADNPNVLADALEAVIGAMFRDGGLAAAEPFIVKHMLADGGDAAAPHDAKSALQEWAQGRGLPRPSYRVVAAEGPDHARRFTVAVELTGQPETTAEGTSKRAAEQRAAELMLRRLESKPR